MARADQVFDFSQRIAACISSGTRSGGKIHVNGIARPFVRRRIGAVAASQVVSAGAAFQRVIARLSGKRVDSAPAPKSVVANIAGQAVVSSSASQVLHSLQHIAFSMAAGSNVSRAVVGESNSHGADRSLP